MTDLNPMIVTFSADISNLASSVSQGQNLLIDFASAAEEATAQIASLAADANVSDLTVQIDSAAASLTALSSDVADSTTALQTMGDEAANATNAVQQIAPAANLSSFVSDIDVAQAQLVLLQSKAADAATSLQEMQDAASQSGDYSGIAQAQAQLVLLQAKAQDAAASLQELQTAESDTTGSSGFSDAISGMLGNLGDFGSGIGSGIQSLLGMGSQLGMTVMGLQMLGQQAQQAASALLTPAATAETTQLSFQTLMHSASGAQQEMEALNTYAATTPMQTQWIDNAAAKILAFGGTTKQVIPEINSIGDALSGLGKLSDASLNSIVDIFGKIQAQGKVTGGDMMQLSNWGIPAWNALSQSMGKSIPVLQQMVSKGLVPASQAIPALEKGMENTFGGGMAKQAQTFSGIISTIASDWQIAMASIGGPLLKLAEQGLTKLSTILASPAFQTFATQIGVQIANVLLNIGNFIAKNVVPPLIQFGTYLGSMAPVASNFLNSLWSGLQQVGGFLYQTFLPVWQQLVITFNEQLVPAWQNFYASIQPVMPELQQAAEFIGGVLVVAIEGLVSQMAVFLKAGVIVFGGIVQIVAGMATVASGYIATFVDIVTGQWGKLGQDMATIGNGWMAVWAGIWNGIVGIFGGAINGLIDMVNGWVSGVVSAYNAVAGALHAPTISAPQIGHVGTIAVPKPMSVTGAPLPTNQQAANPFAVSASAANPFTQFLNSMNQLTSSSAQTATNTKAFSTAIPAAVASAADTTAAATTSGHAKTAAQIQKAADTANAQALRLAADQQKALQDSSSSAVQQLVDKSKAAAAAGDTSTAAFYASQADQLAAQQKSAATKAANAAKSAAKKKAAAAKKASASSKKKTTASSGTSSSKKTTTTKKTTTATVSGRKTTNTTPRTATRTTKTGTTTPVASTGTSTTVGAGTTLAGGTTTPATGATPLTIVLEINGQDFASAVMPFIATSLVQKVRLKTGLKV